VIGKDRMTDSPLPETWQLFDQVHLPYRILLLAKLLDRATARQLREQEDLTLAEWRVLAHLETLGEASSARIAAAAAADRAEVSRAVASLEKAGLIVRRPDSENRKRLLLRLTDEGRKLHRAVRAKRVAYFEYLLADLDEDERTSLDAALLKIARRVET
jgi:DNA-binding MarR family transcriptional regulator